MAVPLSAHKVGAGFNDPRAKKARGRLISALYRARDWGLIDDSDFPLSTQAKQGANLVFTDGGGGTVTAGTITMRLKGDILTGGEWITFAKAISGQPFDNVAFRNEMDDLFAENTDGWSQLYAITNGLVYLDQMQVRHLSVVRDSASQITVPIGWSQFFTNDPTFVVEEVSNTTNVVFDSVVYTPSGVDVADALTTVIQGAVGKAGVSPRGKQGIIDAIAEAKDLKLFWHANFGSVTTVALLMTYMDETGTPQDVAGATAKTMNY